MVDIKNPQRKDWSPGEVWVVSFRSREGDDTGSDFELYSTKEGAYRRIKPVVEDTYKEAKQNLFDQGPDFEPSPWDDQVAIVEAWEGNDIEEVISAHNRLAEEDPSGMTAIIEIGTARVWE